MTPKTLSLGYIENGENNQVLKSLKKNSSQMYFKCAEFDRIVR